MPPEASASARVIQLLLLLRSRLLTSWHTDKLSDFPCGSDNPRAYFAYTPKAFRRRTFRPRTGTALPYIFRTVVIIVKELSFFVGGAKLLQSSVIANFFLQFIKIYSSNRNRKHSKALYFWQTLIFVRKALAYPHTYTRAHIGTPQAKSALPCYNVCALHVIHVYTLSGTPYRFWGKTR